MKTQFTLTINTDNAAFEGANRNLETAEMLRELADRIEEGDDCGKLRDTNGNTVGSFSFSE